VNRRAGERETAATEGQPRCSERVSSASAAEHLLALRQEPGDCAAGDRVAPASGSFPFRGMAVLALQRAAGNRATSALIARRRQSRRASARPTHDLASAMEEALAMMLPEVFNELIRITRWRFFELDDGRLYFSMNREYTPPEIRRVMRRLDWWDFHDANYETERGRHAEEVAGDFAEHEERKIRGVAVSRPCCGHCAQMMHEVELAPRTIQLSGARLRSARRQLRRQARLTGYRLPRSRRSGFARLDALLSVLAAFSAIHFVLFARSRREALERFAEAVGRPAVEAVAFGAAARAFGAARATLAGVVWELGTTVQTDDPRAAEEGERIARRLAWQRHLRDNVVPRVFDRLIRLLTAYGQLDQQIEDQREERRRLGMLYEPSAVDQRIARSQDRVRDAFVAFQRTFGWIRSGDLGFIRRELIRRGVPHTIVTAVIHDWAQQQAGHTGDSFSPAL
jgi:hypothetical protein